MEIEEIYLLIVVNKNLSGSLRTKCLRSNKKKNGKIKIQKGFSFDFVNIDVGFIDVILVYYRR